MPEPLTQEYLDKKLDEKFDKFADTVQRGFQDVHKQMDERFTAVNERFSAVDKRFGDMDKRFGGIEQRLENIDGRLAHVENTMVTVSYLDNRILAMEPFPLPPFSRG